MWTSFLQAGCLGLPSRTWSQYLLRLHSTLRQHFNINVVWKLLLQDSLAAIHAQHMAEVFGTSSASLGGYVWVNSNCGFSDCVAQGHSVLELRQESAVNAQLIHCVKMFQDCRNALL